MIFCDTSAMAKLYIREPETAAIREILESEDQACLSELARIELMAVFHRQYREKKWTRNHFHTAIRQFTNDDLGGFWTWLPLDPPIVDSAAKSFVTLPKTTFLRSADCIHLMTAIHHGFKEIVSYDRHQCAAAATLGLAAVSPG